MSGRRNSLACFPGKPLGLVPADWCLVSLQTSILSSCLGTNPGLSHSSKAPSHNRPSCPGEEEKDKESPVRIDWRTQGFTSLPDPVYMVIPGSVRKSAILFAGSKALTRRVLGLVGVSSAVYHVIHYWFDVNRSGKCAVLRGLGPAN